MCVALFLKLVTSWVRYQSMQCDYAYILGFTIMHSCVLHYVVNYDTVDIWLYIADCYVCFESLRQINVNQPEHFLLKPACIT